MNIDLLLLPIAPYTTVVLVSNHMSYTLITDEACGINRSLEKTKKFLSVSTQHVACHLLTCALCAFEPFMGIH